MPVTKIIVMMLRALPSAFIVVLSCLALLGAGLILKNGNYMHVPSSPADIFIHTFALGLALMWTPLAWLAMTRATPKLLIERYLKEPHFTDAELVCRSVISPLIPFPTTMFMIACTLPRSWLASRWLRRREMTDLRDYAPRWFVWCSRIIWIGAVAHALAWMALFIGLFIYARFFD